MRWWSASSRFPCALTSCPTGGCWWWTRRSGGSFAAGPPARLLLVVDAAQRRLLRREPDGSMVTHADLAPISEKPWNDIVVDARGNAYVNNIGFDFPGGEPAPGSVAIVTPEGGVRPGADDLAFPNGMAIHEEDSTLPVAAYQGKHRDTLDIGMQ